MRYAVEQNSPDGGRSTWPECWGALAQCRGRVLFEHDDLEKAVEAASAASASGFPDDCTWVWDRRKGRKVGVRRLAALAAVED